MSYNIHILYVLCRSEFLRTINRKKKKWKKYYNPRKRWCLICTFCKFFIVKIYLNTELYVLHVLHFTNIPFI